MSGIDQVRELLEQAEKGNVELDQGQLQRMVSMLEAATSPLSQEITPPNIMTGHESLKARLLEMGLTKLAEGVAPGHPGVDYHDAPEEPVTHERRSATAQGLPLPTELVNY